MVGVLFLYVFGRVQQWLPLSIGMPALPPDGSFNTAVSFVTNTNWQWYSGEAAAGHLHQMTGLAVQNFISAAVGMAVAIALIRGLARSKGAGRVGNFWTDLVRTVVRILLPLSVVAAQAIATRLVTTFGLESVALLELSGATSAETEDGRGAGLGAAWVSVAAAGPDPARSPEDADVVVTFDEGRVLALRGRALPARDRRVLDAFAAQAAVVLEYRRLREREARAQVLEDVDRRRSALLRAVSDDVCEPLQELRAVAARLPPSEQTGQLAGACADLATLAEDLRTLGHREAGAGGDALGLGSAERSEVVLVELVGRVVASVGGSDRVRWEVRPQDATVRTDAEVLRRVLTVVWTTPCAAVPGWGPRPRRRCGCWPRRSGTGSSSGWSTAVPLPATPAPGPVVAAALAESEGALLEPEETPGGGLTMVLGLSRA